MSEERHYVGVFNILNEELSGELVYSKTDGAIILSVIKILGEEHFVGRSYAKIKCITGKLNSGAIVTLFNNQVVKNHSQMFHSQQLCFKSDYMIWSNDVKTNAKFNSLTCILRNAFLWSGMSCYERTEDGIRPVNQVEEKSF